MQTDNEEDVDGRTQIAIWLDGSMVLWLDGFMVGWELVKMVKWLSAVILENAEKRILIDYSPR